MAIPVASVAGFATGILVSRYWLNHSNEEKTLVKKDIKKEQLVLEITKFDKTKLKPVNSHKKNNGMGLSLDKLRVELSHKLKNRRETIGND